MKEATRKRAPTPAYVSPKQLIDTLYDSAVHKNRPRTYREVARKRFLQTAQKKNKTHKVSIHQPHVCPIEGKFGQVKTGYGLNRIISRP